MVNKKKRGSSILLVLMVATVMIIISSVVASSLVSTTRMNNVEKREDDILYAAEAGIEQVLSNARKGDYTGILLGQYITAFNLNAKFSSQGIEVEVTGIAIPDPNDNTKKAIKATSVAKDLRVGVDNTKIVQGIITEDRVPGTLGDNLLRYSICANNVNFYLTDTINFDVANINSPGGSEQYFAATPTGTIKQETFTLPSFNELLIPYHDQIVEVSSKVDLEASPTQYYTGDPNYKGIVKKVIDIPSGGSSRQLEIYMVNCKGLIIDGSGTGIRNMENVVILSRTNVTIIESIFTIDSNLKIDKLTGKPLPNIITSWPISEFWPQTVFAMTSATIVGDIVNIYGANYHVNFPTYGTSNSIINTEDNMNMVNSELGEFINGSPSGGGIIGSIPEYNISDLEYK